MPESVHDLLDACASAYEQALAAGEGIAGARQAGVLMGAITAAAHLGAIDEGERARRWPRPSTHHTDMARLTAMRAPELRRPYPRSPTPQPGARKDTIAGPVGGEVQVLALHRFERALLLDYLSSIELDDVATPDTTLTDDQGRHYAFLGGTGQASSALALVTGSYWLVPGWREEVTSYTVTIAGHPCRVEVGS